MGRKRARFDWSADPEDPDLRVPVERESRAPLKARLQEIQQLVLDIVALPARDRASLPLRDDARDALEVLAATRPSPARKRQLNYVKRVMADVDIDELRAAMLGDTPRAALLRDADRWRTRLLEGGDEALSAYVEAYPAADRQRLRALLRRASSSEATRRSLFDALVEIANDASSDV